MSHISTLFEDKFQISAHDIAELSNLKVPISEGETERLVVLRQTGLLDSDEDDISFDRFISLAQRIFNVSSYCTFENFSKIQSFLNYLICKLLCFSFIIFFIL